MDLTYDSDNNTLRLTPAHPGEPAAPSRTTTLDAILDIGEGGRLIGVEFPARNAELNHWHDDPATSPFVTQDPGDRAYIQITPGDTGTTRSTSIRVTAEYDSANHLTAIVIPRRGHGYEISYPSGNQ
jgi:hypothetical protein